MRLIGQLKDEQQARCLAHYLYSQGIESQVDPGHNRNWEIWILDDDQVEAGQDHFQRFQQNPTAPEFIEGAKAGSHLQQRQEKAATPKRARVIDGRVIIQRRVMGMVTFTLMGISIAVTIATRLGKNPLLVSWLSISNNYSHSLFALEEIAHGQIWRLFTPMFLHFDPLHILFNMLWLKDLGNLIETKIKGSVNFLIMVLVIAAISNVGQFLASGPSFGGMSGVVYGLLGYLWIYGKFHPSAQIRLNPKIVQFMIIWFVLCLFLTKTQTLHIANTAHGVGAVVGMAWGYIAAQWAKHR